ncbi:unnamed protein product [Ostreobium quekettii]|uniref:Uncharacterized protein n=1 Tax=Ostreobium quekettii TaxID=121088 RepID=A0A8S1IV20_9CHLO|nr:unnamed protein product [Ostreobium quekettii]
MLRSFPKLFGTHAELVCQGNVSEKEKEDSSDDQDDGAVSGWAHLSHDLLDRVKAQMAEHEEAVFLRRGRLVSRYWCQWSTRATTHLMISNKGKRQGLEAMLNGALRCFTAAERVVLKTAGYVDDLSPLQRAPLLRHLKVDARLTGDSVMHLGLLTSLVDLDLIGDPSFRDPCTCRLFHLSDNAAEALAALTQLERIALANRNGDRCAAIFTRLPALTDVRLNAPVSCVGIGRLATMPNLVSGPIRIQTRAGGRSNSFLHCLLWGFILLTSTMGSSMLGVGG